MTSHRNDSRAAMENELLARLGLGRDANTQDIEAAHDDVVAYLESAPAGLRDWAKHEIAAADEAYALLLDPTADVPAETVIVATAPAVLPAAALAAAPAKAAAVAPAAASAVVADEPVDDEEAEILADEPVPTRPVRKGAARAAAVPAAAPVADNTARNRLLTRLALVGAGLVGVAVLVIAVYSFGGGSGVPGMNGTPAPESQAGAGDQGGVDTAAVAALMQQLQANPNDTAVMQQLADLYYQGGDYATAGTFFDKILAADPKNISALLGRGATAYNVGNATAAEKDWQAVVAIDPRNQDAHYYLGFMYLDSETPDMEKVKAEWKAAIAIAPDSDIAKSIQQHLDSLEALPSASTGAAAAPGASRAPGASSAPSVAPAPSASPAVSTAP